MRQLWPIDHTVNDLFDSPSFGTLWLGEDMEWVFDLSAEQVCKILGITLAEFRAAEIELIRRAFF